MVTDELRSAFRHSLAHAGYCTPPGRAACALAEARAEVKLRKLIEEGIARIVVQDDPSPWDGDMPYDGPLFIVTVEIGNESSSLGGIATSEDDVKTYFDPNGLQANGDYGGYAGQCTIAGYLRTCAVEVAQELPSLDVDPARVRHIDATRDLVRALDALVRDWDDSTHDEPANDAYPFHESLDEIAASAAVYLDRLQGEEA